MTITLILMRIFTFAILFCIATPLLARDTNESTVKAAFVYNFARFTEWPEESFNQSSNKFILCLVGNEPNQQFSSSLIGKKIHDHSIVIEVRSRLIDLDLCQIIFISGTDYSLIPRVLAAIEFKPVLTIGDMTGFAEMGGIFNIIKIKGKMRFQANIEAIKRSRLRISSRLLKLAQIVGTDK
ncbi:MAG: YfiR family protein [Methylococcales bacterium]